VATKGMTDRKLQGQMRHNERVVGDAERAAARVDEWLLPESAGQLEAEGMERTWRFAQVKFPAWTLGGKRRGGVLKLVFKVERSSLPGGGGGQRWWAQRVGFGVAQPCVWLYMPASERVKVPI